MYQQLSWELESNYLTKTSLFSNMIDGIITIRIHREGGGLLKTPAPHPRPKRIKTKRFFKWS